MDPFVLARRLALRHVTSRQNPRVKLATQLRFKRKRDVHGLFLIEGERELERAIEAELPLEFVLVDKTFADDRVHSELLARMESSGKTEILPADENIMDLVCYRGADSRMVAVAPKFSLDLNRISTREDSLVLIAVGLEKPGNLGTILRSADAAGADAVIVCDQVTDVFNPNVVRSSLGTLFSVPVAQATKDSTVEWCRLQGVNLIATTPQASNSYSNVDYTKPSALVIGSESEGLDNDWFEKADEVVYLPQLGQADSLNAAMVATVMLFEARRQRDAGNSMS